MKEQIKKEIIEILDGTYKAIERDDVKSIRDLSNRVIDSGSVFQDENSITIAVVVYAFSKIFERSDYREYKDWDYFYENCMSNLKKAISALREDNIKVYESTIKNLLSSIDKLESKLKSYVRELIHTAQIARGSRFYEHGISIGRTAKLLGVSRWELMEYSGKTGIADVQESFTKSVRDRLRFARDLFK